MKLHAFVDRFGSWIQTIPVGRDTPRVEMEFWRATADKSGTLWFSPARCSDSGLGRLDPTRRRDLGRVRDRTDLRDERRRPLCGRDCRLDREKLWRSCPAHMVRPCPRTSPATAQFLDDRVGLALQVVELLGEPRRCRGRRGGIGRERSGALQRHLGCLYRSHSVYGFVIAFALSAGEAAYARNSEEQGPEQARNGTDETRSLNDPH